MQLPELHPRRKLVIDAKTAFLKELWDITNDSSETKDVIHLLFRVSCFIYEDAAQVEPTGDETLDNNVKRLVQVLYDHETTYGERLSIISNEMSGIAKYEIRMERHGNTDEPGDM